MSAYLDPGILRDTLLPNLTFHTGLVIPFYLTSRAFNYAEGKDILWPTGQLANTLYTSIGRDVLFRNVPVSTALRSISRPGKLLLAGVSLWALRMMYRITSRAIRRGTDDPRYTEAKKELGWWNMSLVKQWLPEALVQALITLPFTGPFNVARPIPVLKPNASFAPYLEMAAVGLFSMGYALEVMADYQLENYKETVDGGILQEGVWSIVRHPNYLGDTLLHLSFPLLLYSTNLLHPIYLLGPIANYAFLRYIGGDKENEASQLDRYAKSDPEKYVEYNAYRLDKNAFWPSIREVGNAWTWIVVGCGVVGVVGEGLVRGFIG